MRVYSRSQLEVLFKYPIEDLHAKKGQAVVFFQHNQDPPPSPEMIARLIREPLVAVASALLVAVPLVLAIGGFAG